MKKHDLVYLTEDASHDGAIEIINEEAFGPGRFTRAAARIREMNASHPERPPLRYGIGLHLGTVTYGNIGVPERLEFTVIGAAANEAARVEAMTKELKTPVLTSAAFAAAYGQEVVSLGKHPLKGLEGEHELFTLPDDPRAE